MAHGSTNFEKFADILEKKIRKQIESEMHAQSKSSVHTSAKASEQASSGFLAGSPDLLAQLLTSVNPVHFVAQSRLQRYPHKAVKPQPRPTHKFNAEQILSYQFIVKNGARLADNFNRKELESAFRALALKLHPDQ